MKTTRDTSFLHHWLQLVGLDRPELRAWALYDWANSAFVTTIVTAVFPTYFSRVAAAELPSVVATARFATATTVALTLMATLTGSSRSAILAVIGFFIAGGVMPTRVDVAEGQRMAGESR